MTNATSISVHTLKTMIVPVCLVIIVGTQIFDYFVNGEFNIIFIAIVCFLTPEGIKGLNPEYGDSQQFKSLSKFLPSTINNKTIIK